MNEDKVIQILLDHTERLGRLENAFTSTDTKYDVLFGMVERIATNINKIHDDHVATIGWLRRHGEKIEKHDKDIARIKTILKAV